MKTLIKRRKKASKHFKFFCKAGLYINMFFLCIFISTLVYLGLPALKQNYILISAESNSSVIALLSRNERRQIRQNGLPQDQIWLLANAEVDQYAKQKFNKLDDTQKALVDTLIQNHLLEAKFNSNFFLSGDSKIAPEQSGILASVVGTLLCMFVCMVVAVPIGVAAAIYLEEFAPQNLLTHIIEVCINNLAGIPSIIFGLLGLALFINFFGVPRSSALVGGLTLAIMSLPIIIVATKAALKSVDVSMKNAALALGFTKWQMVKGIVLPLAMPMILTGSILALAQAIGETAPLMLIGMIAFIPDVASSLNQPTTVLPALIYNWASMPERAFLERAAAGILVLLGLLVILNLVAILLRKYFQGKQTC
ncbi:phosphate ABC transporter permease PtsA [Campylobacter sp. MIT 12-8780]|uniref:phosphate ABC transporter permease PstA n=1 Tax=Campylobacter sp. MIT 12-8780 TaxID=2202200 RepID=UPI00115F3F22|nr:phosphate ABC transporter permease PstA [Campylobacter sp. MIT 12-8780]TQR41295.1 phosphate ABC transporter permease PtsA [Campylobacter sp. MIT 12-8780]